MKDSEPGREGKAHFLEGNRPGVNVTNSVVCSESMLLLYSVH